MLARKWLNVNVNVRFRIRAIQLERDVKGKMASVSLRSVIFMICVHRLKCCQYDKDVAASADMEETVMLSWRFLFPAEL